MTLLVKPKEIVGKLRRIVRSILGKLILPVPIVLHESGVVVG